MNLSIVKNFNPNLKNVMILTFFLDLYDKNLNKAWQERRYVLFFRHLFMNGQKSPLIEFEAINRTGNSNKEIYRTYSKKIYMASKKGAGDELSQFVFSSFSRPLFFPAQLSFGDIIKVE